MFHKSYQKTIKVWVWLFLLKLQQIKLKIILIKTLQREAEEDLVQMLVKSLSFSLMILTCLRKKSMERNLHLNWFDNSWIMLVGMTESLKRSISWELKRLSLLVQWDLQEVAEVKLLKDFKDISTLQHIMTWEKNLLSWFSIQFTKSSWALSKKKSKNKLIT